MGVRRKVASAFAVLLLPLALGAQSVRGTVVDAGGVPVPGAVVRLLNADSTQAARALTNERGEFVVRAMRGGTYRLSTLRIGFRPTTGEPISLAAGEEVARRIQLTGIPVSLGQVRVAGRNSCGRAVASAVSTFALLEQVRAAITATELTGVSRSIAATSVSYSRALDPTGRRTVAQQSAIVVDSGGQPWRAVPTDSLRRRGYVIVLDSRDSVFYYAPGLETLASDEFILDHCFRLVNSRDTSRVGIAFEPIRERSKIAEVRGTLWLDRSSLELRSIDYRYVNVDTEINDAGAGGEVGFVRMKNGGWVVSRWNIRMPSFQIRQTPALARRAGASAQTIDVVGFNVVGGEVALVTNAAAAADTLWARAPLVLSGTVIDSASGAPVADARLSLHGTTIGTFTDASGAFALNGVLPGNYTLQVRTASLDSVNAVNALAFEFTGNDTPIRIRVPNATHIATALCGAQLHTLPSSTQGIIFGSVLIAGDSAPAANASVVAEWTEGADEDFRWKEAKADERGNFRFCGVPIGRTLALRAMTDSGTAEPIGTTIPRDRKFARAELSIDLSVPGTGVFAGLVVLDSANNPVADAEVVVQKTGNSTRTNRRGAFRLRDVPVGTHEVMVRKLGYGPMSTQLTFVANQTVSRRIVLTAVTLLNQVDIRAERMRDPLMSKFEENRKLGLGKFWTREDLATYDALGVNSVLDGLPSVRVQHSTKADYLVRSRGLHSGQCPRAFQDSLFDRPGPPTSGCACYATVYMDRQKLYGGGVGEVPNLRKIPIESIEAVEYYAGPASTPAEYSDLNSNCGVLVIHTRRFEPPPPPPPKKPPA